MRPLVGFLWADLCSGYMTKEIGWDFLLSKVLGLGSVVSIAILFPIAQALL
jgi:hypothetical protein